MSKGNVIDISSHLKKRSNGHKSVEVEPAQVLDMVERRQADIKQERRSLRRTILTEFIGFCVVVPERGLMDVALYDISDDGLSFECDSKLNSFTVGSELAVRIYLTQESYFGFTVKMTNIRFEKDENIYRYGTKLVKEEFNKNALQNFIKFVESVSPILRSDKGDLQTRKY